MIKQIEPYWPKRADKIKGNSMAGQETIMQ